MFERPVHDWAEHSHAVATKIKVNKNAAIVLDFFKAFIAFLLKKIEKGLHISQYGAGGCAGFHFETVPFVSHCVDRI